MPPSGARAVTRSAPAPRSACSPSATTSASGTPKSQRPELWNLYNGRIRRGEHVRVFPISNWTELDVWEYIAHEGLEVPSIYFAHERDVFRRDGMLYAHRPGQELLPDEETFSATVRYRTVGDMSCTGGVLSEAATIGRGRRRDRRRRADRARRDPRRRPRLRGRDGGPQAGRVLLTRASTFPDSPPPARSMTARAR